MTSTHQKHNGTQNQDNPSVPEISILATVFEKPETVMEFVSTIEAVMGKSNRRYELLLIDDGSLPETWEAIKKIAGEAGTVRGFRLSRNFGKESAVMAGLQAARGKAVIIMDADLQHPPDLIPRFIELWENQGVPIVQGVRTGRGNQGILKRILVKTYYALFRILAGVDIENSTDFVLLDRRIVDQMKQLGERQTYFRGLTHWIGYERATIPFDIAPRTSGQSGWSAIKQIRHAVLGLSSFSAKPVFIIILVGLLGLICSFFLGMHTLYNYFAGSAHPGFSTVILLQLIFGSIELICIGLIGIYIVNIFVEVKHRPRFLVSETTGGIDQTSLSEPCDDTPENHSHALR